MSMKRQDDPTTHVEFERPLTERQLEIVEAVSRGLTNPEIAAEFNLADDTVKAHLFRISKRLGSRNRAEMVAIALKHGYIVTTRGDDLELRQLVLSARQAGLPSNNTLARLRQAVSTGALTQADLNWMGTAAAVLRRLGTIDLDVEMTDLVTNFIDTMQVVPAE